MGREWLDRLRGARHIQLYAALVLLAVMALLVLRGGLFATSAQKTALELRLERMLSRIDGVGNVSVMVSENEDGHIVGAVIVVDGIKDIGVFLHIQRAVTTLLDVEASSVTIIGNDEG